MARRDTGPFRLSTERLDFGVVRPDGRLRRTVTLTSQTGANVPVRLENIPPWIEARLGGQDGNRLKIELEVVPGQLSGSGRQTAKLQVHAG